jgi:DNA-binding response OmpR family regulator
LIEAGGVAIDPILHSVKRDLRNIDLTRQEFKLLSCLVARAGHCVSRQALMETVWGRDQGVGAGALDVLVNSLRVKIDNPFRTKLIGTVRGAGYVFISGSGRK